MVELAPGVPAADLQIGSAQVIAVRLERRKHVEIAVPVVGDRAGVEHRDRPAGAERAHGAARRARIGERIGQPQRSVQLEIVAEP